jgi:hypothetical protein
MIFAVTPKLVNCNSTRSKTLTKQLHTKDNTLINKTIDFSNNYKY